MGTAVESSMSPVGLGADSSIRMLGWDCRLGSLGGYRCLQPFSSGGTDLPRKARAAAPSAQRGRELSFHVRVTMLFGRFGAECTK